MSKKNNPLINLNTIENHKRVGCEAPGSPKEYHLFYHKNPKSRTDGKNNIDGNDWVTINIGTKEQNERIIEFITNLVNGEYTNDPAND